MTIGSHEIVMVSLLGLLTTSSPIFGVLSVFRIETLLRQFLCAFDR